MQPGTRRTRHDGGRVGVVFAPLRCGLEADGLISPLPIAVDPDWTSYVDMPITGAELSKVKRSMQRQSSVR